MPCIKLQTVGILMYFVRTFTLPAEILTKMFFFSVLSPMSAVAKLKMNVRTEVDLSLPQV